jgi:hypothetical protein
MTGSRPFAQGGKPSREAGYSGRSMGQNLGLKEGNTVVLIDAPARWTIPGKPRSIRLRHALNNDFDVAVWFVRSLNDLGRGRNRLAAATPPAASLWVAWPRKAGGHDSDVTERTIRELILPLGLVDVKVAALDQDWSGLKLVWRLSRRDEMVSRRSASD